MISGRAGLRLVVLYDETELAVAVADEFINLARAALAARPVFDVALAGGSTPKAAYRLLAEAPRRSALDWKRVRFFFGDERCVPPDDEQSNYKMAKEALFDPLGIDPGSVFRMLGEEEPEAAAAAYALLLRREVPLVAGAPVFDSIMLGLGPDGHTASLFPGLDPFAQNDKLVKASFVPKFNAFRITLTPQVLNAARDVAFATAGDAKAQAVAAVIDGAYDPLAYPAQVVAPAHGRLTWLIDWAAGAELLTHEPQLRTNPRSQSSSV